MEGAPTRTLERALDPVSFASELLSAAPASLAHVLLIPDRARCGSAGCATLAPVAVWRDIIATKLLRSAPSTRAASVAAAAAAASAATVTTWHVHCLDQPAICREITAGQWPPPPGTSTDRVNTALHALPPVLFAARAAGGRARGTAGTSTGTVGMAGMAGTSTGGMFELYEGPFNNAKKLEQFLLSDAAARARRARRRQDGYVDRAIFQGQARVRQLRQEERQEERK